VRKGPERRPRIRHGNGHEGGAGTLLTLPQGFRGRRRLVAVPRGTHDGGDGAILHSRVKEQVPVRVIARAGDEQRTWLDVPAVVSQALDPDRVDTVRGGRRQQTCRAYGREQVRQRL